ncbi:uncharacterized protein EV420DRAFT_1474985 [Desarmillaria tabescens]|uniref:Uncharacterized protein n=1 Tax=Armillaria tabescens TaxID=1929756 RepID=A0AA39NIQ0_ARMTA|nr:uncharacterized protein EV420DRAFT_1474985 [Desarmillaria tabescens]KAK0466208.1 hypothetical protein EV420DRAFT_1474985 [Desarmillaria tabescens]
MALQEHTLTFVASKFLDTAVVDERNQTVYALSTERKHMRKVLTSVYEDETRKKAGWAEIRWRDKSFVINGQSVPWDWMKVEKEGNSVFRKRPRVWQWAGRQYVVTYRKKVGWVVTEMQSDFRLVGTLVPRDSHLFSKSEPAVCRVWVQDLYSDQAAFVFLLLLYSEARRIKSSRKWRLTIGALIKVAICIVIL